MAYKSPLLSRLSREDIQSEPFPHIVKRPALDEAFYSRLVAEYPPLELATPDPKPGQRYDLNPSPRYSDHARQGYATLMRTSPAWAEFAAGLKSKLFVDEAIDLFHDSIARHNPEFLKKPWLFVRETFPAPVQRFTPFASRFVELMFVSLNVCAIPGRGYELAPHFDTLTKLFSLVFYLRPPDDKESEGGGLGLHERRDKTVPLPKKPGAENLRLFREVAYESNTVVMFLNNRLSYHSVGSFNSPKYPRRFIYLGVQSHRTLW